MHVNNNKRMCENKKTKNNNKNGSLQGISIQIIRKACNYTNKDVDNMHVKTDTVAVLGGGGAQGVHGPPRFFASAIFICTGLYCLKMYLHWPPTTEILAPPLHRYNVNSNK